MDTTGSHSHNAAHGSPVLSEVHTARLVLLDVVFPQQVDKAQGTGTVTFKLAYHSTGVDVVNTGHTQTFGQNREVEYRGSSDGRLRRAWPVNVQQHAVVATPVGQGGVGGKTTGQEVVA